MKINVSVAFLLCIVTASLPACTALPTEDESPHVMMARASADNPHVLADLVEVTPVIPGGPRDLVRDYEWVMASIAGQLSADLGAISNAVGMGQITGEQGEYVSGEPYQVAIMQFQLFSALRARLGADIARTSAVRADSTPAGEVVLVAMPFSSLQLNPSLVEYLRLTPTQVMSIQKLMDQERPTTEPLMHELRTISGELGAAIQHSQTNENEGTAPRQRLAARQARLLEQLMTATSRLQQRINHVLDPQQRKKLDSFKRTSEVTMGEGD